MEIEVNVDDILWSASRREKQEMFDTLVDEFGEDKNISLDGRVVKYTSDQELINDLDRLYDNKDFLNQKDREIIYKLSKKGLYDEIF